MRLTLTMLRRDLRSGELSVLLLALVLAVAALTGVGLLTDRVWRAVESEAHQLLGGDLLLSADHPLDAAYRTEALERGLRIAESASFPSMVGGEAGVQLAEIKAVSAGYPLRGTLRAAPRLHAADAEAAGAMRIPAPGTAWPDERLAAALAAEPPARLKVGASDTAVAAIVTYEPDRGINPFAIAPRLVMPLADLPATGLLQPGSRVTWRLHLAGEKPVVDGYRRWAAARLGRGERIEGLEDARPEIRDVVERAQRFLRLAALLTAVLAAVAVGLAARRYMQTHLDACAVMRCLGASERQILLIHGGEFILLGLIAIAAGSVLGYLLQATLQAMLAGLIAVELPRPGPLPLLHGLLVGTVLVVGFVLPPLLRLKSVPTVRVLRREWGETLPLTVVSYLSGLLCLAGLLFWMAGDAQLGVIVLGGFLLAIGVFYLLGRLLLATIWRIAGPWAKGGWRIGLANLRRRAGATLVQAVALSLGLTTLLLLTLARGDLLSAWQSRIPPDAPNRFTINIQPEQRAAVADFFAAAGLQPPELEPMVRGRLLRLNGRDIGPDDFVEPRARRLIEREFNLSSRDVLPAGNAITAGRWHGKQAKAQFSVEEGIAKSLNLHIGDELEFNIAGQPYAARITSLRKLDWDSMRVNFFVIAPAGSLDGQPTSYITSFHLPAGQTGFTRDLVSRFPNLTVIDVAALLNQLQETLDQVVRAVQLVFGFALLAGGAVLYAALQASAGERRHELALLRSLGGRQRQLRGALVAEFAVLGAMAGVMAGGMATLLGTLLARQVFRLDYLPASWLIPAGLLAGCAGVVLAGMTVTWRATSVNVMDGLRSV
jgi:putative ABC transport system permease protein